MFLDQSMICSSMPQCHQICILTTDVFELTFFFCVHFFQRPIFCLACNFFKMQQHSLFKQTSPQILCFKSDFKILLFNFKPHLGLTPSYAAEMLTPYEPDRSFRSSGGALLAVSQSGLKSKGDFGFPIRAPLIRNNLPEEKRFVECGTSECLQTLSDVFLKSCFSISFSL